MGDIEVLVTVLTADGGVQLLPPIKAKKTNTYSQLKENLIFNLKLDETKNWKFCVLRQKNGQLGVQYIHSPRTLGEIDAPIHIIEVGVPAAVVDETWHPLPAVVSPPDSLSEPKDKRIMAVDTCVVMNHLELNKENRGAAWRVPEGAFMHFRVVLTPTVLTELDHNKLEKRLTPENLDIYKKQFLTCSVPDLNQADRVHDVWKHIYSSVLAGMTVNDIASGLVDTVLERFKDRYPRNPGNLRTMVESARVDTFFPEKLDEYMKLEFHAFQPTNTRNDFYALIEMVMTHFYCGTSRMPPVFLTSDKAFGLLCKKKKSAIKQAMRSVLGKDATFKVVRVENVANLY